MREREFPGLLTLFHNIDKIILSIYSRRCMWSCDFRSAEEGANMKKIFFIALILLLLLTNAGCGNTVSNDNPDEGIVDEDVVYEENVIMNLQVIETELCDIELEPEFPIDLDSLITYEAKPIYTDQEAIEVGKIIIDKLHEQGKDSDYVLVCVVHSTEDNVWRFQYSFDSDMRVTISTTFMVGQPSFFVALDGNDGSIIIAWAEEG